MGLFLVLACEERKRSDGTEIEVEKDRWTGQGSSSLTSIPQHNPKLYPKEKCLVQLAVTPEGT